MRARRRRAHRRWAWGLLAAWAVGLVVATVKLHAWQDALSQVLVQVQANALLRARSPGGEDAVQPGWYRQQALALLAAVERVHDDTVWSLVMPGSWRVFDDLEERVRDHIARAFSVTVVETLRRELEARGAALTGLSIESRTAALDITGHCQKPRLTVDATGMHRTLDVHQMPEYASLLQFLDATARLDRATSALLALLEQKPARPQDLRTVVRYSLGTDLSHPASRSLALVRALPEADDPKGEAMANRLHMALACTASRGLLALHDRMVRRNDLLALEAALDHVLYPGLFESPPVSMEADGRSRFRRAVELIEAEQSLLDSGDTAWMRTDGKDLGAAHSRLLARMGQLGLLGPALASRWESVTRSDAVRLQQSVQALLAGTDAALTWDEQTGRFVLSPHRRALLAGLTALLDQPFMGAATDRARTPGWIAEDPEVLGDLVTLGMQRQRFVRDVLGLFPPDLRAAATRYAHARIAQIAVARSRVFVFGPREKEAGARGAAAGPGERLATIDAVLRETGEAPLAQWVVTKLGEEMRPCERMGVACAAHEGAGPPAASENAGAPAAPASAAD